MEAVLLAAGEGSRLRPFTADKPKPMIRAANKPILQYAVESLVANGVRDITIVVGYQRERVQSHFGDGRKHGARISYAFQSALTGTARALTTASRPAEPFLALGGDNVVDAELIAAALSAPKREPALVVHRSRTPTRYGVATLDGDRLLALEEKPAHARSEWVSTGVYVLTPELYDEAAELARAGEGGLPDVLERALARGMRVHVVRSESLWSDAVYPWDLLRVHADLLRAHPPPPLDAPGVHAEAPVRVGDECIVGPGTTLAAGTCIGHNVVIGPNCVLENCVVYDDVQIAAGSILRNTIVGAGTRIGARFTALSGRCEVQLTDGWHHLEDFGAIIGEDCRVGGASTLLPGSIIGNHVQVAPGRTLHANVPDRSHVL
ncbi:MAG TPA: sugar phosphate nucleotidyltransferase [Candidatus Thermoplasmatota archaeon]|nr:sugar phosphate nucleotidyltransferase [Candidatus Thermoplasmatota archaeon]